MLRVGCPFDEEAPIVEGERVPGRPFVISVETCRGTVPPYFTADSLTHSVDFVGGVKSDNGENVRRCHETTFPAVTFMF